MRGEGDTGQRESPISSRVIVCSDVSPRNKTSSFMVTSSNRETLHKLLK